LAAKDAMKDRPMKRYPVHAVSGGVDWSQAACLSDFRFPWETTAPAPTEFRALHTATRLCFRFDCIDLDLVLGQGATEKERVLGSDRVEIFMTPDLELNPYFCLEMAPNGDRYGYRARTYRDFDDDFQWQGLELSCHVAGTLYTVEGSLPLATLRELGVLRRGERQLRAGVYRAQFSHLPEGGVHRGWMSWLDPETVKPDFHVPSSFGMFELMA
jgi:hypothetical protein